MQDFELNLSGLAASLAQLPLSLLLGVSPETAAAASSEERPHAGNEMISGETAGHDTQVLDICAFLY